MEKEMQIRAEFASEGAETSRPPLRLGRTLLVGLPLAWLGILWIHQASLVEAPGQLYAPVYLLSVPPVPAVIFLLVLASLIRLAEGRKREPSLIPKRTWLSPRELMAVYMLLVVAIPPTTFGIIEMLLPWVTAPSYFGTPQDGLTELAPRYFPSWFYPHDAEAIREMFEGAETGAIPWRPWLLPLAGWLGFTLLLLATLLCWLSLFHRQWSEHERLRYPLLLLPLSVGDPQGRHAEIRGLFRHPLTWVAFALIAIHHGLNIAHSYNPAVMALMDRYPLGKIFTERPWTAFRGLIFFHRPQMIGLSYFVATDVLFSGWFFHVIQMFVQMLADLFGYQAAAGFPYAPQQGAGAFMALFFALIWVAKDHLAGLLRQAIMSPTRLASATILPPGEAEVAAASPRKEAGREASGEPLPPYIAVWGALGGFVAILAWASAMKMALGLAAVYFGFLLSWAVVYARLRAEAGVASMWAFPFDQHPQLITAALGTRGLMRGGEPTQLVLLTAFSWLSRGYFPSLGAYGLENEKLAQETSVPLRLAPWLTLLAFVWGMLGGYYVTLRSYYGVGANVLHGGTSSGGYNVRCAVMAWNGVAAALRQPGPPTPALLWGSGAGCLVTAALVAARRAWLRFPFHPLGYALALNYGYALWGPFLVTWLAKTLIHRLGGAEWHRKLMPFFLGLALGDLVAGGLLWIVMAIFGPDITNGYMIQFG